MPRRMLTRRERGAFNQCNESVNLAGSAHTVGVVIHPRTPPNPNAAGAVARIGHTSPSPESAMDEADDIDPHYVRACRSSYGMNGRLDLNVTVRGARVN
jgi:hypothetical protein